MLYVVALGLFLWGSLSPDGGPLAGIFLVPLGLPWTLGIDVFPEPLWPWLAAAAPLLNIVLLAAICRRTS